jgi:ABC-type multidrug transport system fused ATPase/permease subunit
MQMTRLRAWWESLTFATRDPARRMAALTGLGVVSGLGEAAIVVLVVALASRGLGRNLPLAGELPHDTWARAGIALGVLLVLAASHFGSAWVAARTAAESQEEVRRRLLDAYLAASWPVQSREPAGQLQDLMSVGANTVAIGTQQAASALSTAFNLIVVVLAAVVVSVWATLGLLAVAALSLTVVRPFRKRTRRIANESAEAMAALATEVTETAQLARDLRVFGVVDAARSRLDRRISAARRLFEALRVAALAAPVMVRDATLSVLIVAVAAVASRGDVSLPELGATVVLLLRGLSYVQGISGTTAQLQERAANVERIQGFVERWRAAAPRSGTSPCPRVGRVALESVWVTYPDGAHPALADLSLAFEPGEQLGLVGRTGAGKSTLALTLLGLFEPQRGRVTVDGVPLAELRPADWHRRIAWVPQQPLLLTGSVRDNIRFLREDVGDEAVRAAALTAGLGPELDSWPDGIDHDAGSAGARLSGGQRQRVALARALVGDPDLMVLDEPTSALDVHTEVAVREGIAALRGRATVVVIAHRLSTLDSCDRVAVLDGGRLIALGSPDELAANDVYYREALTLSGLRP